MVDARQPITVLVVDDSKIARAALRMIFEADPRFHVIGEAKDGREATVLARRLLPRLITMDLDMPGMNGLEAIEDIMATAPTRILVLTGTPTFSGQDTCFEALSRGALDLLPKPVAWPETTPELAHLRDRAAQLSTVPVVAHVGALATRRRQLRNAEPPRPARGSGRHVVVIGASTGGPRVLSALLGGLPADFSLPIVIVQHFIEVFASRFIAWLESCSTLPVGEAAPGALLRPGTVHVAVRGPHVVLSGDGRLATSNVPPRRGHQPSIDVLFESAARYRPAGTVALLLTGMGEDGAIGLEAIAAAGGCTAVQDEASSVVFGMAKAAIDRGAAQQVLSKDALIQFVIAAGRAGGSSRE